MGPPRRKIATEAYRFRALDEVNRNATDPYEPGWLSKPGECVSRSSFTHTATDAFEAMVTGSSGISCPEARRRTGVTVIGPAAKLFFSWNSVSQPGSAIQ